jgi:hypothetical protein
MNQPSPETFPKNRARIAKEVLAAAKDADVILPQVLVDDLVEVAVCECIELRERIASRILGVLIDRGEGCTAEQLERLAYIVEQHFEDETGSIELVEPPKLKPLRRI